MIQLGKKKLVLDHLVVQNLGKETEEGDVESMIMYGAKALYDENSDKNDIVYTSKDVDDIIENIEKQAEEEAKAIADRERVIEAGGATIIVESSGGPPAAQTTEGGGEGSRPKETMSFGFAKIWESVKNPRPADLPIDEDEEMVEDDLNGDFAAITSNVEKDRQAREIAQAAAGYRAKRARKVDYELKFGELDDTPKKKKWKGKGKESVLGDSSDAEFAFNSEATQSDDDLDMAGMVHEGLGDLADLNSHGPRRANGLSANGKKRMSKKQVQAYQTARLEQMSRDAALAVDQGQQMAVPAGGPSMAMTDANGQSANSQIRYPGETPEQRAARKEAKRNRKAETRLAESQHMIMHHATVPAPSIPVPKLSVVEAQRVQQGREVLQWLYRLLDEFRLSAEMPIWARLALAEVSPTERRELYWRLAIMVDQALIASGQSMYFTRQDIQGIANMVFDYQLPVLPEVETHEIAGPPLPDFNQPTMSTTRRISPVKGARPKAPKSNGASIKNSHAAANGASVQVGANMGSHDPQDGPQTTNDYVQSQASPSTAPSYPASSSWNLPASTVTGQASGSASRAIADLGPSHAPTMQDPDPCDFCGSTAHVGDCPLRKEIEHLLKARDMIINSNMLQEKKVRCRLPQCFMDG